MARITEAIYTNGVLKPTEELPLREAQRVRLIIEPLDDEADRRDRSLAIEHLLGGIERMSFYSLGALPSRDELHGRD